MLKFPPESDQHRPTFLNLLLTHHTPKQTSETQVIKLYHLGAFSRQNRPIVIKSCPQNIRRVLCLWSAVLICTLKQGRGNVLFYLKAESSGVFHLPLVPLLALGAFLTGTDGLPGTPSSTGPVVIVSCRAVHIHCGVGAAALLPFYHQVDFSDDFLQIDRKSL